MVDRLTNRALTKALYYRYSELELFSLYLGDERTNIYAKQMTSEVRAHMRDGLFDLTRQQLVEMGMSIDLIRDISVFSQNQQLAYIERYKESIPQWLHRFLRHRLFDPVRLKELVEQNKVYDYDGLCAIVFSEDNCIKDSVFKEQLINYLTYMSPDRFPISFANKYSLEDSVLTSYNGHPIVGSLHNHSLYSDGRLTLEQMVREAIKANYLYFGFSEHTKSSLSGLDEQGLIQQMEEIDELNATQNVIRIMHGIECEIRSDGSLDFQRELLSKLDYVIIGVHTEYGMSRQEAMKRMIRAIEDPSTDILAHPTARIYGSRPGLLLNMKEIIDACVANDVVLEINGNHKRLDLEPKLIEYALDKGAFFLLSSDAHSALDFRKMNNAVLMAESVNLPAGRCLNLMPYADLIHFFRRQHQKR